MKAAVCHAFGEPLNVEDVELRGPGPGEVSVRRAEPSAITSRATRRSPATASAPIAAIRSGGSSGETDT